MDSYSSCKLLGVPTKEKQGLNIEIDKGLSLSNIISVFIHRIIEFIELERTSRAI